MSHLIESSIGVAGTLLGMWLTFYMTQRQWRRQQYWLVLQKHYSDLLGHLAKARLALLDQAEYFEEPGSEHVDHSEERWFKKRTSDVREALGSIQELVGPARMFLSVKASEAIDKLAQLTYQATREAVCDADYIGRELKLVREAEAEVLAAAQKQLKPA